MALPGDPAMISLRTRIVLELRLFFIALQFFTRLPIPRWVGFEPEWLQQANRYFPAVGVVVGVVVAGVYLLADILFPQTLAVLLSTAAGIYLTGAFHEDGFADTCDGLGGGSTRERALQIMTDSRIGAYGAIGIGLLLAIKCAALITMPGHVAAVALLLAHPWSRVAASSLMWRLEYVKGEGKAKPMARRLSTAEFGVGLATAAVPLAAVLMLDLLTWQAVCAGIAAGVAGVLWLARKLVMRLGGYTGDCLGAGQQLSEVLFYLALLAATSARLPA